MNGPQRAAREQAAKDALAGILGTNLDSAAKRVLIERCQAEIKAQLKAPGTASFDSTVSTLKIPTSGNYMVLGSVEAQNGFGARLTNSYACEMEKYGEQWIPKSATVH
jgi:hypothetical protein